MAQPTCQEVFFIFSGAHPREPLVDLLTLAESHTTSLEDHGRQLSKTLGQMTSMFSGEAVRRMLPTSPSKEHIQQQQQQATGTSAESLERKFADLKTSFVEKCQSSSKQ